MLAPGVWEPYFSKAEGIEVWLFGDDAHAPYAKYLDFLFIVGTNILGYCDEDVNEAVIDAVKNGNMCSLNCPEEVELAEKLLKLHPWAGGVRYAKGGGEAMSVAVRIARAYTGRDNLACGGYFGWGDFYLANNLQNPKNLDELLLPGLEPAGVPKGLKGTAMPFNFNDIEALERIAKKPLAAIIIEPMRHTFPTKEYVKGINALAEKTGAVLISDEITVGFRKQIGSLAEALGYKPDMVVYSKAMSNGYPMAAIIGRREIMDVCQAKTFISSTSWSDRIGFAASLATIEKLKKRNVPAHLTRIGKQVADTWEKFGKSHDLHMKVHGDFEPIATFEFDYGEQNLALNTLFVQEMLERGILSAPKGFYASFAHKKEDVAWYAGDVDEVFGILKKAIDEGSVKKRLRGGVAHSGFKRLVD
jgi:glutamate-1-semialdehyde aminotransferase